MKHAVISIERQRTLAVSILSPELAVACVYALDAQSHQERIYVVPVDDDHRIGDPIPDDAPLVWYRSPGTRRARKEGGR